MSTKERIVEVKDGPMIGVESFACNVGSDDVQKEVLELQLKMATSSINHEYARIEFEDINDRERRDDLLEYMHDCRRQYFEARSELKSYDPYALADFEADLIRQKQSTLTHYNA